MPGKKREKWMKFVTVEKTFHSNLGGKKKKKSSLTFKPFSDLEDGGDAGVVPGGALDEPAVPVQRHRRLHNTGKLMMQSDVYCLYRCGR